MKKEMVLMLMVFVSGIGSVICMEEKIELGSYEHLEFYLNYGGDPNSIDYKKIGMDRFSQDDAHRQQIERKIMLLLERGMDPLREQPFWYGDPKSFNLFKHLWQCTYLPFWYMRGDTYSRFKKRMIDARDAYFAHAQMLPTSDGNELLREEFRKWQAYKDEHSNDKDDDILYYLTESRK